MSVPILNASAWREFRGIPSGQGLNKTTHLAKIADAQGKLHDCFVKLLPRSPALLCEAIGWVLAKKSGVSCPAFAAIVLVPVDELRKCSPLPPEFDGMAYCPAWCSEVVAGKAVRQIHKMAFFLDRAKKTCLLSGDVRKIAAFDKWADLRDRNFGNVIRSSNGGYVAIDHESLLHDLLWLPTGAGFHERCLLNSARTSLSAKDFQRFQVDMANAAHAHAPALEDARNDLDEIIGKLIPQNATAAAQLIYDTLSVRAQAGWLSGALGVIA